MCEVFCVSSKKKIRINAFLEEFYSHSDEHPHGWGLAVLRKNDTFIEKEAVKANDSKKLQKILEKPVSVENVFAHIRLATIGRLDTYNTHPFTKRDLNNNEWVLIHNGTVFNHKDIEKYKKEQYGQTDSERILYLIVDMINNKEKECKRVLTDEERFKVIEELFMKFSRDNKLNVMIYDGNLIYVHTNYRDSLYYLKSLDTIIVSTSILTNDNWKKFPINRLIALKNGEVYKKGKRHDNEFKFTELEYIELVEGMDRMHG